MTHPIRSTPSLTSSRPWRSGAVVRWLAQALCVLLCTTMGLGCASSGLQVTRLNSEQKKPNNVWVFFTVEDGEDPVPGLAAEDFDIYEDDSLVSVFESKQTIQNPEVAAVMYTLLLLDMSGSVTESGQADLVVDAAQSFTEKVSKTQKVAVYAFDGDKKIRSVVRFTGTKGSVDGGLEGLRGYTPRDPSTNLHGAVVEGLDVLRAELDKDKRPLKFGTVVVFTDGTDRAARVTEEEMVEALGQPEYDDFQIFAIGVGAEIEESALSKVGRDGTELVADDANVQEAFDRVAQRIEDQGKRFYLLSYCTPARNGEHTVRIKANAGKNAQRKVRKSGEVSWTFDATGFGPPPECNPERQPSFDLDDNLTPDEEPKKGRRSRSSGGDDSGDSSSKGFRFGKPSQPGSGE